MSPCSFFRLICAYGVGFVEIKDSLSDSEVQYVSSTPATRWEHNRIYVKDAWEGYFATTEVQML